MESSINRVASEQWLSWLKFLIIVQSVDLAVRPWMEVNHFPSACIWRTELTSPAVKSFMTLQCCGPHSTRPASADQRLHSNSQHAHRPVQCFRTCAKKKTASADTNYRCWFRQAHWFTSTRVGRHLLVSPWSWFCTHVSSEAALIYKICLNLLLSSTLLHHQSASVSIFMSSAEGLVGETEKQSLVQDSSRTWSILSLSCRCCLNWSKQRQVYAVTITCFLCCSAVTWLEATRARGPVCTCGPLSYLKTVRSL